ncbi:hypothetical protein WCD74_26205 [Actinomycetospora sp. OC33-EN08]|uniref:Uncharacterized protein n=1 Tax=Actinomycetospora aurantiaca TaxID=3129233 RepID=A0ABU8MVE3_9PSEU
MTPGPASRGHGRDARELAPFLDRHDALLQPRAAILGHAYGAGAHDVFLLTRAALHDRWPHLATAGEDVRALELTLLLVRTARSVGGHATPGTHRPRPAAPPPPRAVLAARGLDPTWRHPDPWRLLAVPAARPLRALAHLDPLARDLAVLRWLDVPAVDAAPELGLPPQEFTRCLDAAVRQWAAVTAAADAR